MAIRYSKQFCINFDAYNPEPCGILVTSDDYALTKGGKRTLKRISVPLQRYDDNTFTQKVWKTILEFPPMAKYHLLWKVQRMPLQYSGIRDYNT